MKISDLIVTQHHLRKGCQIDRMVQHVKAGGKWDEEALASYCEGQGLSCFGKIALSRFGDGKIYIHDGHHRAYSTLLAGRDELDQDEFVLKEWTWAQYKQINHANKWYTPFNPQSEVRKADLTLYRKFIANQIAQGLPPHEIESLVNIAYCGRCAKWMRYWELRRFTEVRKLTPTIIE